MALQHAKGMRDFAPNEKIFRDTIIRILTGLFERFGFAPLDTPLIERFDVLASKFTGGEEILKETFRLRDQGGRDLGLRYDLTVPLARFVGMNPELKMPFKRYQIGKVFRDGPIKLGRYREFYQCDVDIVGAPGVLAEAELLLLAREVFAALGLEASIQINDRRILDGLLNSCQIPANLATPTILALDKITKLGPDAVKNELVAKGVNVAAADLLLGLTNPPGDNEQKLDILRARIADNEGLRNIETLLGLLADARLEFTPGLARGLSYYTATIFEVFIPGSEVSSSVAGGGRYDRMIADLLQIEQRIPAVGISFGLEPIVEILKARGDPLPPTPTQAFIIPIQARNEALTIAKQLRKASINTEMDLLNRGISANLKYANAMRIPFVIIIGEDERKQGKLQLKEMTSGEAILCSIAEAIAKIRASTPDNPPQSL